MTQRTPAALAAHLAIRTYQLTLSAVIGRHCRYLPTCSDYADEAITRHGFWRGGWMGLSRICRCHPWGGSGFDPVPDDLPEDAAWWSPWRYGFWRAKGDDGRARNSLRAGQRFRCRAIDP